MPSQSLADSQCAVHRQCGGCPLLGYDADEQRRAKTARLLRCLEQAGVRSPEPEWISDGRLLGYRNRIRLRIEQGTPVFFNRHKALDCAVLQPSLHGVLGAIGDWASQFRAELRQFQHLEARAPDADGVAGLAIYARELAANVILPAPVGVVLGQPLLPVPKQRFSWSAGMDSYVPVTSFMQVNTRINDLLISRVQAVARASTTATALDLYCGSGSFALALLRLGVQVSAVELDALARAALLEAAERQGLTPGLLQLEEEFHALPLAAGADVAVASRELAQRGQRYDLVIANPPRAGLGSAAKACAALAAREFLLCCCKAESFARDSRALTEAGFELQALAIFDMFPGTEHLEAFGHFSRRQPG